MTRKRMGKIFIFVGCLLILAAVVLLGENAYRDERAGKQAQTLLNEFIKTKDHDVETEGVTGEMPKITLQGYSVIGVIEIPRADIQLPVLSDWSYDLLNVAPCRYSGSVEDGDLIILGHNYQSHFTPLQNCVVGDEVKLWDVNHNLYQYRIEKVEKLYKTELDRLTSSDYDLTIFTCTYGGQSRFVARCMLLEGS
ncbi:MAG: sortase [Lachnospiraceae bacterium]